MKKHVLLFSAFACLITSQSTAQGVGEETLTQPRNLNIELLKEYQFATPVQPTCRVNRISSLLNSRDRLGFGSTTTGGAEAQTITVVSSLEDNGPGTLREAVEREGPNWIVFDPSVYDGTIFLESPLRLLADTTIDGRGIDRMSGITLSPTASSDQLLLNFRGNVIIHGIALDGLNTDTTAIMLRTGNNYWLDHISITGFLDDALSIGRGVPDAASDVTISNYHAYSTDKGMLTGSGVDFFDNYPTQKITLFNSLLNANQRNPLVSTKGQTHMFNNVIISTNTTGLESRFGAVVIAENNVASGEFMKNPSKSMFGTTLDGYDLPTGHVFSSDNLFINGASSSGSINPDESKRFDIPYSYNLIETNMVESYVQANAGALNADPNISVCE